AAHFRMRRRQEVAASSNGQDAVLSRLRWKFDSSRCYQEFVCLNGVIGGVMPGRSMAGRESLKLVMSVRFAPRQPDLLCIETSRSGEGYGYFSFKENTVADCSLLMLRGHSTG